LVRFDDRIHTGAGGCCREPDFLGHFTSRQRPADPLYKTSMQIRSEPVNGLVSNVDVRQFKK
jgi:hypothetical protein